MTVDYLGKRRLSSCFVSSRSVSFQITVLKVLVGHPSGLLSVDDLKRAVSILICSGPHWTDRMKRPLARAPGLDIFSQALVVREAGGWRITKAGLALLSTIENPVAAPPADEPETVTGTPAETAEYSTSASLPMLVVRRRPRKSRRRPGLRRARAEARQQSSSVTL